jgi:hypothetical protein
VGATFNDFKEDLKRRAQDAMVGQFGDTGWTLRQKVASTCRALFDGGHDSGLAGQITARAEQPGTFYTQQLSAPMSEIRGHPCCRLTRPASTKYVPCWSISGRQRPAGHQAPDVCSCAASDWRRVE